MFQWSDEHQMIRDAVKRFVDEEVRPHVDELEHGDLPPYDILRKLFATFGMDAMARDRFKQTDADVGSFDAGYGSAYLAKMVGQKAAREIFFLGRAYTADDMHRMGAVNLVAPHAEIETTALGVAREIMGKSPQAIRMLKFAFNLVDDGLMGQQVFAGEATRLAYMTDEAVEGRDQFLEKRDPDWSPYPWHY